MNSTSARMSEDNAGLQATKPAMPALKPWEIAELPLLHFPDGQVVDVEHASDAQFETWRMQNGIPAKPGSWSFERRCKAINQCRFYGVFDALRFPVAFCAEEQNSTDSAQNSPGNADSIPPPAQNSMIEQES